MMNEQQWNELNVRLRQEQKDERRRARIEKSRLYWIFDPRLHETHQPRVRDTAEEYRRMRIRYFFSWEGLSKFLLAPVFKIGLTSIIVTPFIASAYISLREAFGSFFDHQFPVQMGLLFLSGLLVVIARIIYELSCPKLVKAQINCSPMDTQSLQNKQWLRAELEHCFLQYVDSLPMTEDYIRAKHLRKMREGTEEACDIELGRSAEIQELGLKRVGYDVYGVWLIQNLLLRIAKEKGHKLFVSWSLPKRFSECQSPQERWDTSYTVLYFIDFSTANRYAEKQEEMNQGDLLLSIHEVSQHALDEFPKHAVIHAYFNGIHEIIDLGADDVIKEFIAENENYWKPFIRIAIAIILLVSLVSLLIFLAIQTMIVGKAIYFSFFI